MFPIEFYHSSFHLVMRTNPDNNYLAITLRVSWKLPASALAVVLCAACAVPQAPTTRRDPCAARLPAALSDSLTHRFPGHRPVRVDDYLKEDVTWFSKENGGERCIGMASADENGDGSADFALLLIDRAKAGTNPNPSSGRTLFVAARSMPGGSWVIDQLDEFAAERPCRSFVGTLRPGTYRDLFMTGRLAEPFTAEPGQVRQFGAVRPGFVMGRMESTAVAFFFTGGRWVHLWLAD
jgi:hypothetical protein